MERILATVRLLTKVYEPSIPRSRSFSPHRLSTISELTELTEDNRTSAREPEVDLAASPKTLNADYSPPTEIAALVPTNGMPPTHTPSASPAQNESSLWIDAPSTSSDTTAIESDNIRVLSPPITYDSPPRTPIVQRSCLGCDCEVTVPCWLCIDCPGGSPSQSFTLVPG